MTHPTRDELLDWQATGAPEARSRMLTHLAGCDDCRRAYAELVRLAPEPTADTTIDRSVFLQRGLDAYGTRHPPVWWKRRSVWIGVPAAAAAVVVLSLSLPRPPAPLSEPSADARGSALAAVAPAGAVDRVTEFRWTSPITASRYRIIVRNASGAEALSRETTRESITIEGDAAQVFRPGRYTWSVEALGPDGRVLTTSRAQTFEVKQPSPAP